MCIYIYIKKKQNNKKYIYKKCIDRTQMILLHSFYLYNLFTLWPIKTDFGFTTLATRKQSQLDFPTPHHTRNTLAANLFYFQEKTCVSLLFALMSKKQKIGKKSRNIVSSKKCKKTNAGFPTVAKPKRKTTTTTSKMHLFDLFFILFCSFLLIVCSLLFGPLIFLICFFIFFMTISCILLSLKLLYFEWSPPWHFKSYILTYIFTFYL